MSLSIEHELGHVDNLARVMQRNGRECSAPHESRAHESCESYGARGSYCLMLSSAYRSKSTTMISELINGIDVLRSSPGRK